MTYLEFLLLFIVPPLAIVAALWQRSPHSNPGRIRAAVALPAVCVIAVVYTTPWDNYLVWRGVWSYGPDRILGTIGWVPLEEYLFFILQSLFSGCWFYFLLSRSGPSTPEAARGSVDWVGTAVYATLAIAGVWLLRNQETLYLGLILAWGSPVLAFQWGLAGHQFWRARRVFVPAVLVPTVYLWIADRIAIGAEIWAISDVYTTGFDVLGLPIEEAAFFLATNLLVVQGLALFVWPPFRARPERGHPGDG